MKFKDDIIKRLRRDIRELTKNGVDKERNVEVRSFHLFNAGFGCGRMQK